MTRRVRYEVLPTSRADLKADPTLERWTVSRAGERLATYRLKPKAVAFASSTARAAWEASRQLGQLLIKRRDGTIQDERTYGADPRQTKG